MGKGANMQTSQQQLNTVSQSSLRQTEDAADVTSSGVQRGNWGGRFEFLLTCIGYAVGLGNVWRFPYLAFQNGGGAFLIPYIIMLIFVGLPIFYFELALGQFASRGPLTVWVVAPIMKGVGFCMVAISFIVSLYYNVIISWAFYFLFRSFAATPPWMTCVNQTWADHRCLDGDVMKALKNDTDRLNDKLQERNLTHLGEFQTPSEQFFYNEVLQMSGGLEDLGSPVWELVGINALCWFIVFLVLINGIRSLGKVMYLVTVFPYIMMTILLVQGLSLEGAIDGVIYYIEPKMDRLLDATVWQQAATQIFFSLSACMGGLIAMSSYNDFKNNCFRDALIVPVINCFTSLYAGFTIFAVLGFMANEKDVSVADVAETGPGLVFVVYPEALAQMPIPTLWSILFFIMLITLGFSSLFAIVETMFVSVMDEFPSVLRANKWRPIILRGTCVFVFWLLSIPMVCNGGFYLFSIMDSYSGGFPLLIIGLSELLAVNWIYGFEKFATDIELMLSFKPNIFFRVCWTYLSPGILVAITVFAAVQYSELTVGLYTYPPWGYAIGWLIVVFLVSWIPLVAIAQICKEAGLMKYVRAASRPTSEWHPANIEHCTGKYATPSKKQVEEPMIEISSISLEKRGSPAGVSNEGFMEESDIDMHVTERL